MKGREGRRKDLRKEGMDRNGQRRTGQSRIGERKEQGEGGQEGFMSHTETACVLLSKENIIPQKEYSCYIIFPLTHYS